MAFKVAGSLAFKKAIESLKPVLLEPIVLLCVSVPDEYMGDVIGDLSSRRGKVLGSDSQVGITEIKAHIPMSEVLRYAPDLRSITGGQGVFTMEFDHYEEAPAAHRRQGHRRAPESEGRRIGNASGGKGLCPLTPPGGMVPPGPCVAAALLLAEGAGF